jgi:hypothetical protein
MIDAPATIASLARYVARKAIRQQMQDDGYKPRDMTLAHLDAAARAWLEANPWAFEYAAKRIENYPRLRKLAEIEARERARQRKRQANVTSDAQRNKPCSDKQIPVQISGAE